MGSSPTAWLEQLVARGESLAGLERLLQLSPGYLSKVRRGRASASPQLVALLRVLLQHPEVRHTLAAQEGPAPRRVGRGVRVAGSTASPFLERLISAWGSAQVRFHGVDDLLLERLKVRRPRTLEPSARFLVHPDDRHALAEARALGAAIAMASSRAAIVSHAELDAQLLVVFPLAPYHRLFARAQLDAIDAALYFALQSGEEAEGRLRAVAKACALGRGELVRCLERDYGRAAPLPAKEWLLRSTFDPEGARERLARLP